jgi:hypothetical protein
MQTITQPISACAAQHTRIQAQSLQIREVQEAIREADSDDFATDDQLNAVFAKYGV